MVLLLLLLAAPLENAGFDALDGWEISVGATHGGNTRPSTVRIEDGRLLLQGDARTGTWRMVLQRVAVKPGDRVLFQVAAGCKGLRREGNQYRNANALLLFEDEKGRRTGLFGSPVLYGDRDRVDLHVHALAPKGSVTVRVGVFASMSGTTWFDDARLQITHTLPLDREARGAAVEALRLHLDRTYPFFGLPGKPKELTCDVDEKNFVFALQNMLAPLDDVHLWIDTPLGRLATSTPRTDVRNWNLDALRKRVDKTGRIGDIGYLAIDSFEQARFQGVEQKLDALLENARALILDVRWNGGGDERLARRIAARFTDEQVTYAMHEVRDATIPGTNGFGPRAVRRFGPLPGRRAWTKPVVVLQGPFCVSSTEGFLLMMKALKHVTTVGLRSRGASGNPRPFPLMPGYAVWIPTWRALTMDGKPIEGRGVEPDHRIQPTPAAETDVTLEAALRLLAKG